MRALATTIRTAGAKVGLLLDRKVREQKNDMPLAAAVQILNNEPPTSAIARRLGLLVSTRLGYRRRLPAHVIRMEGVEAASLDPPMPSHDLVFNASNFFDFAHAIFTISGRSTRIVPEEPVAAMHWTAPVPAYVPGVPNLVTLHDVIPLQYPHLVIDRGGRTVRLHKQIIAKADHIVTVSERSRADIMALLGVPGDMISNTYQPVAMPPQLEREIAERLVQNVYGVRPGSYVFFCGAVEPKKNLYRLIEAFQMAGTDLKLLVAGPLGWLYDDVVDLIATAGSSRWGAGDAPVRRLGYLPRRHMIALMQCARYFAFPSIYEGFGIPVVEAMQLGTPVLTSTGGALPEIVGDAGLLVDPLDTPAMSQAIRRLADDRDLRDEFSRRGRVQAAQFSGENYAARLGAVYKRLGVTLAP